MMEALFSELITLQDQQATGQLRVKPQMNSEEHWRIYLHEGKIVWVAGSKHFVRRWARIARQYGDTFVNVEALFKAQEMTPWAGQEFNEFQQGYLLIQATKTHALLLNKAKALLQDFWNECFFTLLSYPHLHTEWLPVTEMPQKVVWLYMDTTLKRATTMEQQWQQEVGSVMASLPTRFSPEYAPLVAKPDELRTKVSENTFNFMTTKLNGQLTFWDLAVLMQKPLSSVARSFLPLLQAGILQQQDTPDFSSPLRRKSIQVQPGKTCKGVIACVDDSPVMGKTLEAILSPLGYEIFHVIEPIQGLGQLISRRPALIFLDLMMPNTNGYEVCAFLRKSTVFKETPIVMLTGRDGVVDRIRAKVVGSTEFLSKPPEADKVIQVVQRLLGHEESGSSKSVLERMTF
jgi:two-component system, chemotaxis family, response regulator PixG